MTREPKLIIHPDSVKILYHEMKAFMDNPSPDPRPPLDVECAVRLLNDFALTLDNRAEFYIGETKQYRSDAEFVRALASSLREKEAPDWRIAGYEFLKRFLRADSQEALEEFDSMPDDWLMEDPEEFDKLIRLATSRSPGAPEPAT